MAGPWNSLSQSSSQEEKSLNWSWYGVSRGSWAQYLVIRFHVKLSNCLIVRPVEGDDIQVSIVGTSDDVPLSQSSSVDSNLIEVLVALCRLVQSGSQNKMVRVDSPNGLHNGSEVAD